MNYRFGYAFDVAGTKSFRLSSRMLFGEIGGNAQNMPEDMRAFMVPDPGKVLIQIDQSGAEALIVAYLTESGNYRALFNLGIKPHTYIALNIFTDKFRGKYPRDRYQFRTPQELIELPEWPTLNKFISKDESNVIEYQLGKKTAHAKAYNMGPLTFQKQVLLESEGRIQLSFQEAKTFLQTYEKLFPDVIEWQAHLLDEVRSNRLLYNLFGYPRRFDGRWNNDLEREALSYIPQSTVGCLTSMTFTDLFWYAHNNGLKWDILVNVHDAVVAQVPIGEETLAIHKTQELFGRELVSPRGEKFYMKSEGMVGHTWRKHDMMEVK